MRNSSFFYLFLFTLFFILCEGVGAQSASLKQREVRRGVSYKKMVRDSVRVPVNSKGKPTVKRVQKKGVRRARKNSSVEIDSIRKEVKQYYLGERVIMRGDSGRDVREVAKILVNKLYISESEIIYTSDGGVLYDGALVRAVKHFQEFNGFHPDGMIGMTLIKALRKKK